MVQAPLKSSLTLEEFLVQPEIKPASEYVDGQVFQKPMPGGKHSRLQSKLLAQLQKQLGDEGLNEAFPELRCTFGGRSTVPDIAVFQSSRIPTDDTGDIANIFPLPPAWTIEILSPEQSSTKVVNNILHCLDHGCEMGWLLDPADKSVTVYPKGQQPQYFSNSEARLPVPEFAQNFELTVGQLFAWLQVRR